MSPKYSKPTHASKQNTFSPMQSRGDQLIFYFCIQAFENLPCIYGLQKKNVGAPNGFCAPGTQLPASMHGLTKRDKTVRNEGCGQRHRTPSRTATTRSRLSAAGAGKHQKEGKKQPDPHA